MQTSRVEDTFRTKDLEASKKELDVIGLETLKHAGVGRGYYDYATNFFHLDTVACKLHDLTNADAAFTFMKLRKLYLHQKSRQAIRIALDSLKKGEQKFDITLLLVTFRGEQKWLRVIGTLTHSLEAKETVGLLFMDVGSSTGVSRDIGSKEVLIDSFEHAISGIGMVNLNGRFIEANPYLCKMLGYEKEELLEKSLIDFVPPEDFEEMEHILVKFLTGKIHKYSGEKMYVNRKGHRIPIFLMISITKNTSGSPLHFVIQASNLFQLYQSKGKLASLLEIVTNQNKRFMEFTYIVSHNIRSHTSNLAMLTQLLKMKNQELTEEYLNYLDNSVEGLQQTISDLNEIITLHTNQSYDLSKLMIYNTIEASLQKHIFKSSIASKVIIQNSIPQTLGIVHSPKLLYCILNQIIENSVKFKKKDVDLILDFKHESNEQYDIIKISDNGIGIDLDRYHDQIFGLYKTFAVGNSNRGVGLFLVKHQMEALQGKVQLSSTLGKGTTVQLYFKKMMTYGEINLAGR
ncbi:PAS domain S-box-containing protein [Pustulibacterium marinum]|uniref:histidine kinase n=1 Tax=Pustulibacterium marinum TaxID=1224947 RepID=A0A1I7IN31_9FLAO|nr:PAS domain-containing sensor histidine kinase [Pustulibacterium marinum]SFU74294.1 PAS domain S-box-containing protein [Pustulibacterium marinum]